jgi:hypothetical protein
MCHHAQHDKETTKMFELDTGSSGVGGPFLAVVRTRNTRRQRRTARSFYIRDGGTRNPTTAAKGMVLDISQDEDRLAKRRKASQA